MKYEFSYEVREGQYATGYHSIPVPTAKDYEDMKKLQSWYKDKPDFKFTIIEE